MRDRLPMIFSITALLVAVFGVTPLGEAAYNAVVPKNSVGTPQLQRNAVTAAKIAPNAVRTGHVLDGTLLVGDFKPGQIPQGPKGDRGDKGDTGGAGVSGYEVVSSIGVNDSATTKAILAACPGGKRVLGGGGTITGTGFGLRALTISQPSQSGTGGGWLVHAEETTASSETWRLAAFAICANVAS